MSHPKLIDLVGQRFGRLVVIGRVFPNYKGQSARWECRCDCGQTTIAVGAALRSGNTRSCGCLQIDRARAKNTTHGESRSRAFSVWHDMMRRCYDQKRGDYSWYGGRGIYVCDRWHKFENFLADMWHPPPKLTLDRKDNDGPYSPQNCRWATRLQQRRNSSQLILVKLHGEKMCLAEACEILGLKYNTINMRIYRGASVSEALGIVE